MALIECGVCGEPFTARTSKARFCGPTCRSRAHRRAKSGEPARPTQPVQSASAPDGLVGQVRSALEAAGKLDTVTGQQALAVAAKMLAAGESGSAVAALSRDLSRLMAAVVGAGEEADVVDEVQRKRDEKITRARQAQA